MRLEIGVSQKKGGGLVCKKKNSSDVRREKGGETKK